jgi:hypothetical protein
MEALRRYIASVQFFHDDVFEEFPAKRPSSIALDRFPMKLDGTDSSLRQVNWAIAPAMPRYRRHLVINAMKNAQSFTSGRTPQMGRIRCASQHCRSGVVRNNTCDDALKGDSSVDGSIRGPCVTGCPRFQF